jgi:hypothetical protein
VPVSGSKSTFAIALAIDPSPKAAPPFAADAPAPTATDPVATAPVPMAIELTPVEAEFSVSDNIVANAAFAGGFQYGGVGTRAGLTFAW